MASLGDYFPADKVREHVVKQLTPGCVVRIEVVFPETTKPKFLVLVADCDPDYLTFVVNSETHSFIANRPELAKCQVSLDAAEHTFLTRNSQIACHQVLTLKRSEVIKALTVDVSGIKGRVSQSVQEQILAAVKFAVTLSAEEKNAIIQALS